MSTSVKFQKLKSLSIDVDDENESSDLPNLLDDV